MALKQFPSIEGDSDEILFGVIAQDIESKGYSVLPDALPEGLASSLFYYQQTMEAEQFKSAGIGRGKEYSENKFVRTDEICWITGETETGQKWLDWSSNLGSPYKTVQVIYFNDLR